jgi:hypothetical protein
MLGRGGLQNRSMKECYLFRMNGGEEKIVSMGPAVEILYAREEAASSPKIYEVFPIETRNSSAERYRCWRSHRAVSLRQSHYHSPPQL